MKDKKERMNRRTIITAIVVTLMSVSNVVRAIDAEREINLWISPQEILDA